MAIKTPQKKVPKKAPVKSSPVPKKPIVKKTTPAPAVKDDVQRILDIHSRHLDKIDNTLSLLTSEIRDMKRAVASVKASQPAVSPGITPKPVPDSSWHALIEPNREYTQKEIIGITKISQPTLSMAKVRGHIVTKEQAGKRGWVVLGSELLKWDNGRAKNAVKKAAKPASKVVPSKKTSKTVKKAAVSKPAAKALAVPASAKTGKTVVVPKKETRALAVQSSSKTSRTTAVVKKTTKTPVPVKKGKAVNKPPVRKSNAETEITIPNDIPGRISALTMKKVVTQTQFGNDVGLPQKVIYEITTKKRKELNPATIQKITAALRKYESK